MGQTMDRIKSTAYYVTNWSGSDIPRMHEVLERPNWAPWLSTTREQMIKASRVFPEGQLLLKGTDGEPLASISTNRIKWDGDPKSLGRWQDITDDRTCKSTYEFDGNTLIMMWINVSKDHQGSGYAKILTEEVLRLAKSSGIDNVIGAYRPNEYGKYKLAAELPVDFEAYCKMVRKEDGLPVDAWLRNLTRNGMRPLKVDSNAFTIDVTIGQFEQYRSEYRPELWKMVSQNVWECGETGSWTINPAASTAAYSESKLWGIVYP